MDDAPILSAQRALDAALTRMDDQNGFAILHHKGREIILMSPETFEEWEDAVDAARLSDVDLSTADTIGLAELRSKYAIAEGVD